MNVSNMKLRTGNTKYRISANSFRGNSSFLTKVQKLFKGGNYSREDTIQGWKLFKGGNYSRAETIRGNMVVQHQNDGRNLA